MKTSVFIRILKETLQKQGFILKEEIEEDKPKITKADLVDMIRQTLDTIKPTPVTPQTAPLDPTVIPQAPIRFPIFRSFPQIEHALIDVMSEDYYLFIDRIEYAAPKPSTFRIVFKNNDMFYLMYNGEDKFTAKVSGMKYDLNSIGELERCIKALNTVIIRGSLAIEKNELPSANQNITPYEGGEGGGGGGGSFPGDEPKGNETPTDEPNNPQEDSDDSAEDPAK